MIICIFPKDMEVSNLDNSKQTKQNKILLVMVQCILYFQCILYLTYLNLNLSLKLYNFDLV